MNVFSFSGVSSFSAISFFKEALAPALSERQKKVILIASIALGLVAVSFAVILYCLKQRNSGVPQQPAKPKSVTYANGTVEEGEFGGKGGLLHGKGKRISSEETEEGTFAEGVLIDGTRVSTDGERAETVRPKDEKEEDVLPKDESDNQMQAVNAGDSKS